MVTLLKAVKEFTGSSSQVEVYVDMLHLLAQPKEGNNQFKNKQQAELPENGTV